MTMAIFYLLALSVMDIFSLKTSSFFAVVAFPTNYDQIFGKNVLDKTMFAFTDVRKYFSVSKFPVKMNT